MTHPSNFRFLSTEYPLLFNIGQSMEYYLHSDPVVALVKMRVFCERIVEHCFDEECLAFPATDTLHTRLKKLEYERVLTNKIKNLFHLVKHRGNIAAHEHRGTVEEAQRMLEASYQIATWFYQVYSEENHDLSTYRFQMPPNLDARHALHQLEQEMTALEAKYQALLASRTLGELPEARAEELHQRRRQADRKVEMSEAQTRELIDLQLREAGWEVDTPTLNYKLHKTMPARGRNMAIAEWPCGRKWADYALFIGTELYAIVEAKKYARDISSDLRQAKTYAELVETRDGLQLLGEWQDYRVPFIFSTNGRPYLEQLKTKSGIWFLDVREPHNHARALQDWFSPKGLEKLLAQDIPQANQALAEQSTDFLTQANGLSLRDYQLKAIEAVEKKIRTVPDSNRALVAMATGTGKTRTIIGLCYRLIQSNRFRRILFLVDRRLLATQAMNAFLDNKIVGFNTFAEIYKVEGLKEMIPDVDTRLHFATVQSMVKRLLYQEGEGNTLTVDAYDCIIVDEAHRGYLLDQEMDEDEMEFKDQNDYTSKYRQVLDYFDAYAIGLTATPALHTKQIFGEPVFVYAYPEAVIDGWLIDHEPPYLIKTRLSEEGMLWEKGEKPKAYDQEENRIIELDELEDELLIEVQNFNRLVITENFNRTVLSELVRHLDPEGEEKTLIFAATDAHADMVVRLLYEGFTQIGIDVAEGAIEKITGKATKPEELTKRYKNEQYPNIAVTVDLLSTGIDVPAICNLVFLRRVRSRILYEQMLGRATRRCDDIGKEVFRIYDAVRIYEALEGYTNMKPVVVNPRATFSQLAEELPDIPSDARVTKQVEQIIAKLQRKKQHITGEEVERFQYHSQETDPESFINMLQRLSPQESVEQLVQMTGLWKYLDELKPPPAYQLFSEHDDELQEMERGYGQGQKPEDYLQGFARYIEENKNKIEALQLICTRPRELDRQSLRELRLLLEQEGYNSRALQSAWQQARNEDIAADIISYIRTLALGTTLVSHEERIRRAVSKVRQLRDWNKVQQKWLDLFEKQLIAETVLQRENLDEDPFDSKGGYARLNKIFDQELDKVLNLINEELYKDAS